MDYENKPCYLASLQFRFQIFIRMLPISGSFAGGNLLTLNGAGFGSGSIVKVCDSLCKHGDDIEQTSSSYDQIICRLSSKVIVTVII